MKKNYHTGSNKVYQSQGQSNCLRQGLLILGSVKDQEKLKLVP